MAKQLLVISDIHGQFDRFVKLLKLVNFDSQRHLLVSLGDLIDRGPQSMQTVDLMLQLYRDGSAICLRGNHEEMMLDAMFAGQGSTDWFRWLSLGGSATLDSYGSQSFKLKEHIEFMGEMLYCWNEGQYFFAHAGIRPGVSLEHQSCEDLLWIREDYLFSSEYLPMHIVSGHTPTQKISGKTEPVLLKNRTFLDTGAAYCGTKREGRLTMMQFPSRQYYQA